MGLEPLLRLRIACKDGSKGLGRQDQQCDLTARNVALQGSVESIGHDQAHKKSWQSTVAKDVSSMTVFYTTGPGPLRQSE